MDDDLKRRLILGAGLLCIVAFLYFVFSMGAGYACFKSDGYLLKNSDGMRCVNLSAVDLCRDYTGKVIEKPVSPFNFTLNISGGIV